jgi:hypothetical protein
MSRSYWLPIIAAVGLTVAVGTGLFLQPEKPYLSGDHGYRGDPANYRAGGSGCDPANLNLITEKRERLAKKDACEQAKEQHREATNSIIEARRAADAADASAVSSYQQTRVSAWGLTIGLITLLAAIAAAFYTRRAAEIAEKALTGLERPYIFAEIVSDNWSQLSAQDWEIVVLPEFKLEIKFKFKNVGRTPAYIHSGIMKHSFCKEPPPDWDTHIEGSYSIKKRVLGMGEETELITHSIPKSFNQQIINGPKGANLMVFGQACYSDMLGGNYEYRFKANYFMKSWLLSAHSDRKIKKQK